MQKKIILWALLFVLLAVPAACLQLQSGVMLDGRFFVRKNANLFASGGDSVVISRTADRAEICVSLGGEQLMAQLTVTANAYSFAYADGRTVEGYAGIWDGELADADGAPLGLEDGIVILVGDEEASSALTRVSSLSSILYCMAEGICEQRGHPLLLVMAMAMYAIGAVSFFWPEKAYFFGRRWRYANAELSYDGIAVQKISGVVCALMGIVLLYAPLFW